MEPIVLTDAEITIINDVLKEAKSIPLVEGVYLSTLRTVQNSKGDKIVDIVIAWNGTEQYLTLLGNQADKGADMSRIFDLIRKTNDSIKGTNSERLCISDLGSEHFSFHMTNFLQIVSLETLVNSNMLFDRFGELGKKKEYALSNEKLRDGLKEDVPVIENIDQINTGEEVLL